MTSIRSFNSRLESLKSERSTFIPSWCEMSDYILSSRGRFLVDSNNKGGRHNLNQINNKPKISARTLASGMMSGITSPSRPWFQLSTGDPSLNEHSAVKEWLHAVQQTMYRVYSSSNTYNALHNVYMELGVFGTATMGVYADFENVIHCKPYTAGEYMIATNGRDVVDTFYREYQLTVSQLVKEFGIENVSRDVRNNWENGNTEAWVDVVHAVEPNDDRDHMSPMAKDKKVRSVYYEKSSGKGSDTFLRESGFDDFPVLGPRWGVAAGDVYGTDYPGMDAIGDAKALQLGERRKYQAVDIIVKPPMQGPSSMKSRIINGGLNSGDIVWTDKSGDGLKSVYDFRPDLNAIQAVNMESEQRVSRAFYEDLFLMLANSDRRQITAREVAEKQEEKLLMLGPVLERLHSELLDPLIDRTFNILQKAGVLPPPPPELNGRELDVEYVSVLAQAQRMVAVTGIERTVGFAAEISQIWPEARYKVDAEQVMDDYAVSMGVNPKLIRSDDQVAEMKQAEQAQMQQAEQMAAAQQGVDMAKTASEVNTTGDNGLTDMIKQAGLA